MAATTTAAAQEHAHEHAEAEAGRRSASDAETFHAAPSRSPGLLSRAYLFADVIPELSTWPLTAFCFMTGFTGIIGFSAIYVWPGFQTGNTLQLGMALARLFQGPAGARDTHFHIADRQALTSLLTFLAGAFLGRIGDRLGAKTRAWLLSGTLLQALLTMAAALCLWKGGDGDFAGDRGDPSWTSVRAFACLGFLSASLGLQGIMGKRVNTQFATTIVLTTVWCELMADPQLFTLRRMVISRDHKILGVAALFLGGFVGRAVLQSLGGPGTLGVAAGLRALIALAWLWVPAKAAAAGAPKKAEK